MTLLGSRPTKCSSPVVLYGSPRFAAVMADVAVSSATRQVAAEHQLECSAPYRAVHPGDDRCREVPNIQAGLEAVRRDLPGRRDDRLRMALVHPLDDEPEQVPHVTTTLGHPILGAGQEC